MKTHTINNAGVRFGVIHNHILTVNHRVDHRNHSLITIIQQISCFAPNKSCKLAFKLLVIIALTRHHTRSHRISHTKLCSSIGIGLANIRMIGKTKIIVQTPDETLFASEFHLITNIPFQFGKHKISFSLIGILPQRTHINRTFIKNVHAVTGKNLRRKSNKMYCKNCIFSWRILTKLIGNLLTKLIIKSCSMRLALHKKNVILRHD